MEIFFEWLAFLGSWLLFAGPIYQAALELREQDLRREELDEMQHKLVKPDPISAYWWFLPPVKLYLEHRQSQAYREAFLQALPTKTVEAFVNFMNKATGWGLVALGGLLLAVHETFGLLNGHYHLALGWVLAAMVVVAYICLQFTVTSIKRSNRIKQKLRR